MRYPWVVMIVLLLLVGASILWAEESVSTAPPVKEYEAPVAQVQMGVQGTVRSIDPAQRTFTIMQPPKHRQPPMTYVIGVNKDTKFVRNEAIAPEMLQVGDAVRVEPSRPAPYGVMVFAEGKVSSLAPLIIEVSPEVKVVLAPKAEVVLVRINEMKYEEITPGLEANVIAYRGTTPLLAIKVQAFGMSPAAAKQLEEQQKKQ